MAGSLTRLNTRDFDRTLKQYMQVSKRDLATVINTKGFFIARRAVIETPKADRRSITQLRSELFISKLINKRRGARGEKGLYGQEMKLAVRAVISARLKSIAFLKSGWLQAIKKLAPFAERRGAPRADRSAKQIGQAKGNAIPARPGWKPVATIINAALSSHDRKDALQKYGRPALQAAIDFEVQSMKEYMARKLNDSARKLGIRTR